MNSKIQRKIDNHLKILLGKNSLQSIPWEELKKINFIDQISREIDIGSRRLYLTEKALLSRNEIEALIINELSDLQSTANDIFQELKKALHLIRSQNLAIPSASKITEDIRENIKKRITSHTIATPIHGIHLENIDSINLGNFKITKADRNILKDCASSADMIENAWKPMQHSLWLVGTIQGTSEYSQKKFISTARSTCALLSLVAATVLELGAARVSIQPELCGVRSGAVSFMINNTTRELSLYREVGSPSTFQISETYIDYITGNDWFYPLLEFLQNPPKIPSEIQKTLTRSIYWFYEAQSDPAPEMKLVKFWSCIECFYSFTKKEITQSIINGMIATLVFGGYKAYPLEAIPTLKKEIEYNYDLRSRAVHDAQHEHITLKDVANVSRWAGFLVMELFSLSHQLGYTTRKEVKEQTDRLSKILTRSKE